MGRASDTYTLSLRTQKPENTVTLVSLPQQCECGLSAEEAESPQPQHSSLYLRELCRDTDTASKPVTHLKNPTLAGGDEESFATRDPRSNSGLGFLLGLQR